VNEEPYANPRYIKIKGYKSLGRHKSDWETTKNRQAIKTI